MTPSIRCPICSGPRADHGYTAVADHTGKLGPWHEYRQGAVSGDLSHERGQPGIELPPCDSSPAERRTP